MKKKLALFLAVVLAASQLGGYIPANAADGRIVMEPSELKGNSQNAFAMEETISTLKMTPDGETDSYIQIDNWDVLDRTVSEADYPYVGIDYYFDVEEGGSWKNWRIGSTDIDDMTESDAETLNQGPDVVDYDADLVGPKYVAKLVGTDTNSSSHQWTDIYQTISSVTAGDTYVFSCDYYVPDGAQGGIRIYNSAGNAAAWVNTGGNGGAPQTGGAVSTLNNTGGSRGTMVVEYTVQEGETWFKPAFRHESEGGESYYWNFCVSKKATVKGVNNYKNLLKNGDFSQSDGSWIGWRNITDTAGSDTFTQNYGPDVVTYDASILGDSEPKYMAQLIGKYTNSNNVTHSWKDVQQIIWDVKEGETYVFSCKYYMPAGSRGNIRFYAENVSGTAIWTARGLASNTTTERGTMVVEYTVPANCTWIAPTLVQEETGLGYYWDICLMKKGGDGTNLLTNADFTADDGKIPENMTIRMLPDGNNNEYRSSENTVVSNQWARVIFDYSDWYETYGSLTTNGVYGQMHFFPWGRTNDSKGTTADGTMYINNISFYAEKPGTPSVTGISFIADKVQVVRDGSVRIPAVTVEGENYPITAYDLELSGHSSANTKISDGYIYIGADETAETITITAKAAMNTEVTATCTVNVKDVIERTDFDETNITTRFGVVSDVHISGSWNQERSVAKFAHTIEALQKTAAEDNAALDAILVNGDLVDAVASLGNVDKENTDIYGSKAVQNFREVNYVAQGIWGAPAEGATSLSDTTTGYGAGVADGVKFFYSLGNHDEGGKGETSYDTTKYEKVNSAEYFAAVICGWQYKYDEAQAATAAWDESYVNYINDLIDYNKDPATVNAEKFYSTYGVTLESAVAKFDKYYGFDTNYSNEDGLLYGNRHMTIGEGKDAIHFVALELSISDTSLNFLDKICTQSVKENPNKPIFVITHYKVSEDMPGYEGVQNRVREMMAKYPQIIAWGGHSHSYLQSDLAIDSDEGFIQVDSSATAYASQQYLTFEASQGDSATGSLYAENAASKENHAYSMGCYVEVDANFNVRINRIDLYRSFSADYAEDTGLYSHKIFTEYTEQAKATPVNTAVFTRTAWDITDIGLEGIHLADYTNKRIEKTEKPVLTDTSTLNVKRSGNTLTANISLDATDDGMVYMYVVELWDATANSMLERHYYTNKFYDYPDISKIPAIEAELVFEGIEVGTTYEVKAYPVDDFDVAGEAISETVHKVKYVYVSDISQYRSGEKSYPDLEGYAFAGWYQGTADVVPTTDETLTSVAKTTTDGGAWAKYVPEEVLSVKAQTTDYIAQNPDKTKLRLVSTVDSLRYSEVGFKIKFNQGNKEYTYDTNTVYETLTAIDSTDIAFTYLPTKFSPVSEYFMAYTIKNIDKSLFDNYEFAVTPYWVTLDGTTVKGVARERLLVTDQLADNADGCDFTVEDSTYTYTMTKSDQTASYQYFKGASDLLYVEGIYTKADANNQFGLSIRNGGEERQIFFAADGVKVVNQNMETSGLVDGKEFTISDADTINKMISAETGTETKIVWEIKDNVLYCSLGGVAVYEVSMENLCSDWKDGRYYQVGIAGYNTDVTTSVAKFVLESLRFSGFEVIEKELMLSNTYYRLQREKELKVAYIGGSVTYGVGATDREQYSWRARTTAWLQETYSGAKVTEINAAISGTGSAYGAHRAVYDLKLQSETERPDLVFIEFAINDMYDGVSAEDAKLYTESLVKTIYQYAPQADIIFVFTTDRGQGNACYRTIEAHMEVAEAYQLPCISVGARLYDEIVVENGGQAPTSDTDPVWAKYFTDGVHPTDAGYEKYASYVTAYLREIFSQQETIPMELEDAFCPEETLSSVLVNPHTVDFSGHTFNSENITLNTDGSIESNVAGTTFTFKFTGTDLRLLAYGTTTGADLEISIDGNESQTFSLYRSSGQWKPILVAQGLQKGEHTVTITLRESEYGLDMTIRDILISGSDLEGITEVK